MRILGVLLILLGLTLFASPRITYTKTEEVPHTRFAEALAVCAPVFSFLIEAALPSNSLLTIGEGEFVWVPKQF